MENELGSTAAALAESSATQRKWASFVLLGPLMPSLLAVVIIVVGGAVVKVLANATGPDYSICKNLLRHNNNSFFEFPYSMGDLWLLGFHFPLMGVNNSLRDEKQAQAMKNELGRQWFLRPCEADVIDDNADISCGYPIDQFLTAAIVNSYLLLMVFAWSFLGFETHFSIRGRKRRFLRPFSSLSFVAFLYLLLFILSAVIWIYGTWAVAMDRQGNTCSSTVPLLFSFCLAIVVIYWIGFFFGAVGLTRIIFGRKIQSGAQATFEKGKQYAQNIEKEQILAVEKQLVGRKFDARDAEGNGTIDRQQAEELMEELGMGLSSKKLKKALARLDPEGEDVIWKDEFLSWYAEIGQED